jgi:pyruvate/2-oxoacid:ferredoxin oxidoreductase alpha subunit
MDEVAAVTGRPHKLFEYSGHPEAERVIIAMGSGCPVIEEAVEYLNARGEKVGLLKVRQGTLCRHGKGRPQGTGREKQWVSQL